MPLVVFALGAYVVGLYAGFADSFGMLLAGVAGAWLVSRGKGLAVRAAFAALVVAGSFVAHAASTEDQRCRRDVIGATAVRLELDDAVEPGMFGRGHLADCESAAALSVDVGAARAGSTVLARGEVVRSTRGVMVQHATICEERGPSVLSRLRHASGQKIDELFHGDAPLVRALLIADRSQLPPALREQFAAAGLAHVLAIAGLHVGIIALALTLGLELAGVPRRAASVCTIIAVVGYVAMIGAPIPAVRSATMMTVLLTTRLVQRPTSRWAIVALGASHPVLEPRVALDVGYQLSVVGVCAMIAAGMLGRRLGVHRLRQPAREGIGILLGTTVATIGSAPIVAWVFGRVSLVAPLTNLVVTPLLGVVQPMIFVALVISPIRPLAALVADAAHPLLVAMERSARFAAELPYASPLVAPTMLAACIAGAMSAAVIVACASRAWHRPALLAGAGAAALAWLPLAPAPSGMTELHMIDVGQGDAVAVRTPHAHWILVDAGGAWSSGDAGKSTVVPYIGRRGGSLDLFVLTHPHTDHVGGAASVFRALHPSTFIDGGFPGAAPAYRSALAVAHDAGIRWARAHPGDSVVVDGVIVRFLAPDSTWTTGLNDPNLASVVTLIEIGTVRMLLMGDAERPEEEWLREHRGSELHADVLKVGHHGSQTSSSEAFLDAVRPRVALVSVGERNMYHLPTPSVMQRLAARRAQVLRTDRLGSVVVRTDGRRILINTSGDEWELPASSPP